MDADVEFEIEIKQENDDEEDEEEIVLVDNGQQVGEIYIFFISWNKHKKRLNIIVFFVAPLFF